MAFTLVYDRVYMPAPTYEHGRLASPVTWVIGNHMHMVVFKGACSGFG